MERARNDEYIRVQLLTPRQLRAVCHISRGTLNGYIKERLLIAVYRRNGRNYFAQVAVDIIRQIQGYREAGLKLAEIKKILYK